MPKFLVELEDGKKFEVEADSAPSEEDVYAALDAGMAEQPQRDPLIKYQGVLSSVVPKSRQLEAASAVAGSQQAPLTGGVMDALRGIPDIIRGLANNPMETLRGAAAGVTEGALDQLSPINLVPYGVGKAAKVVRAAKAAPRVIPSNAPRLVKKAGPSLQQVLQEGVEEAGKAPLPELVSGKPAPTQTVLGKPSTQPTGQVISRYSGSGAPSPRPPKITSPKPSPVIATEGGMGTVGKAAGEAADPADPLLAKFAGMMEGKGAKVSEAATASAIDAAVAADNIPAAAEAITQHTKLTVNEFAEAMRRRFGSQRAGDYMFPALSRAERQASIKRLAPGPSRTPQIVEEARMAAAARRAAESEKGFAATGALASLGGGLVGGLAGATQGEETEDRLQNALIGAAAGMAAPRLLSKLFTGGAGKGIQEYTIGAMLSSPVSMGKAWLGAYGGALMAASSKAAAGEVKAASAILEGLSPTTFIPRMVQGFRTPAASGYAQNSPNIMRRIYGAADYAAREAMMAGGISADDAARFTLSGSPTTQIGGKTLGLLSGDRPIDFALRLMTSSFPRVGIQSIERGLEFSPIGLSKGLIGKASTASSTAERIGRAAIGTGIGVAGAAASEHIPTWMQPLVVAGMGPAGLPAAAGMAFGDARRSSLGDKVSGALEKWAESAPAPRYGLFEGAKQAASGSQLVPNVVASAARAMDPYEREATGFFGRTIAKIPGEGIGPIPGRESLPIRGQTVNVAGQPLEERGPVERFISGARVPNEPMKGIPERVAGELTRLEVSINPPSFEKTITVGGTKMDVPPEIAERARAERRSFLLPIVEKVINSHGYQAASDSKKKRMLQVAISAAESAGSAKSRASVLKSIGVLRGGVP